MVGYYYHGEGIGTTGLFVWSDDGRVGKRDSDGYFLQTSYKFGPVKLGVQYGLSKLDYANAVDQLANPTLVENNKKITGGLYYSVSKNLTLLLEGSNVKSDAHVGGSNTSNTVNIGAFVGF